MPRVDMMLSFLISDIDEAKRTLILQKAFDQIENKEL